MTSCPKIVKADIYFEEKEQDVWLKKPLEAVHLPHYLKSQFHCYSLLLCSQMSREVQRIHNSQPEYAFSGTAFTDQSNHMDTASSINSKTGSHYDLSYKTVIHHQLYNL